MNGLNLFSFKPIQQHYFILLKFRYFNGSCKKKKKKKKKKPLLVIYFLKQYLQCQQKSVIFMFINIYIWVTLYFQNKKATGLFVLGFNEISFSQNSKSLDRKMDLIFLHHNFHYCGDILPEFYFFGPKPICLM